MTEDEVRHICTGMGATLSIKKRDGKCYTYVARWLPRHVVEVAGHKLSTSNDQQFDHYVWPLSKLTDVSENMPAADSSLAAESQQVTEERPISRSYQFRRYWQIQRSLAGSYRLSLAVERTPHEYARHRQRWQCRRKLERVDTQGSVRRTARHYPDITHRDIDLGESSDPATLHPPRANCLPARALPRPARNPRCKTDQSTDHRMPFVPSVGEDSGAHYSYIWIEKEATQ
jgi:hypothetical protein